MTPPRVKICGLTTEEAVIAARDAQANYIGFVFFASSPRNILPSRAAALSQLAPAIPSVAVVVNTDDDFINTILSDFRPNFLQLHGQETIERVTEIKQRFNLPVIKAFQIRNGDDIARSKPYEQTADMILFDAKAPSGLPGGNGITFDWHLLAGRSFSTPWFLSGGLNTDNVEEAIRISGASLVDVSSSLESSPGVKSPAMIQTFMKHVKFL